jgi:hypothetical protein
VKGLGEIGVVGSASDSQCDLPRDRQKGPGFSHHDRQAAFSMNIPSLLQRYSPDLDMPHKEKQTADAISKTMIEIADKTFADGGRACEESPLLKEAIGACDPS